MDTAGEDVVFVAGDDREVVIIHGYYSTSVVGGEAALTPVAAPQHGRVAPFTQPNSSQSPESLWISPCPVHILGLATELRSAIRRIYGVRVQANGDSNGYEVCHAQRALFGCVDDDCWLGDHGFGLRQ